MLTRDEVPQRLPDDPNPQTDPPNTDRLGRASAAAIAPSKLHTDGVTPTASCLTWVMLSAVAIAAREGAFGVRVRVSPHGDGAEMPLYGDRPGMLGSWKQ